MSSERDYASIANQYADDIVKGRILACKWTILACKRHQADLAKARAGLFEYVFDSAKAARVCYFIEGLPYPSAFFRTPDSATITLEGWQVFNTASIFGWVKRDEPARYRFREAFLSMARKNAKSTWAAGVADYKFAAEDEHGAQVFFGAASREQAMDIGFTPALAMIQGTPELCDAFGLKANKKSVTKPGDPTAVMKPIVGKPGDGASPHCAVLDEFHEAKTDHQRQAMKTGMGARKNPLLLEITTAGFDLASPCRSLQDYAEKVLDGIIEDERFFANIYTLDEGDDYTDVSVAIKANPNLGVSVDPDYLQAQITAALNSASEQPGIKTKNFNLWVADKNPWIRVEDWKACADSTLRLEDFVGEECFIGLDLADVCDLASKMRLFERTIEGAQHFYLFGEHSLNEVRVNEKRNAHFQTWAAQGHLKATPGNTTSYPLIMQGLLEDCEKFVVREVDYDAHHAGPLVQFVEEHESWDQGAEFVKITPNVEFFTPAMREFEKAVLERRVHHTGDPVLTWSVSNTICRPRGFGNIMPDKKRAELKIDPTTATLNAFGRANGCAPTSFTDTEVMVV